MRPRLKRSIEVLETPEGDLILMRANGFEDIRIESPEERGKDLIRALDGGHSTMDLEVRFGRQETEGVIERLGELGLIEDASDDDLVPPEVMARFDRQLRYFGDLAQSARVKPSECQARLADAKVAILGVGGLGGRVALELACCGVGELWLVDGDRVEVSNLNRQIQYTEADVGSSKVGAMAARLRAFNSKVGVRAVECRLESEAQLRDFVAGADLVVDAADWPPHEVNAWCNTACFELGIPHIAMAQFPPKVKVGPLYVPGSTGCHECQQIAWRRDFPLFDCVIEQQKTYPSPAATLGPASGLIAAQVGMDVVHFLTGLTEPASFNAACIYDLRTMELERFSIAPESQCPVCSHLQSAVAQ